MYEVWTIISIEENTSNWIYLLDVMITWKRKYANWYTEFLVWNKWIWERWIEKYKKNKENY